MDTDTTMTTMSSMFAERMKQQVVETTNYVEENVVSQLQSTSSSSFVLGELLVVVEGDVLSIYSKSMSKTIVSLTTIQWMMRSSNSYINSSYMCV